MYTINPHHLTIFHAIAEAGSVSRGAERAFISQPAASAQLRDLERELNISLFNRLPRGVALTQAGEILYEHTKKCQFDLRQTLTAIDDLHGLRRGALSIGASLTTGSYYLPQVTATFSARYPDIHIDMTIENSNLVCAGVFAGRYDIGFTEGETPAAGLTRETLFYERLCIIASPANRIAKTLEVSPADLSEVKWIVREEGSGTRAVVERTLTSIGVRTNIALTLGSTEAIKRAVCASDFIAVVSRAAAAPELEAGMLVEVDCPALALSRPFWIIYSETWRPGPAALAFASAVKSAWTGE